MKKYLKITALLLCVLIAMPFVFGSEARAVGSDPIMEIGLYYGLNALPAAKLLNVQGEDEGYYFGFYDEDRVFNILGMTDERAITITKDKPMWMTEDDEYYEVKPSSYTYSLGPSHLQIKEKFDCLDDAEYYAELVRECGYRAFPAYVNGIYRVRVSDYPDHEAAEEAMDKVSSDTGFEYAVVGYRESCYTVSITGTDTILFEYDNGTPFGIKPWSELTWFKGYKYRGGFEYDRVNGNDITVTNMVSLHDYVKGILPYEMNNTWPIEALKAQALCAKSFAVTSMGKHKSLGFDLCNTTDCQVYYGANKANEITDEAVDDTWGLYVTYGGEICETYYHATSGGHTEDIANVWGGNLPYMLGVEDPYLTVFNPYEFDITLDDLTDIMRYKGYTKARVTDYYVKEYTRYGNVKSVTVEFSDGQSKTFTKDAVRTHLNNYSEEFRIHSMRYTIESSATVFINDKKLTGSASELYVIGADGLQQPLNTVSGINILSADGVGKPSSESGVFHVSGTGSGHNLGLSQWGAYGMANEGWTFDEIITHYFTGVDIEYAGDDDSSYEDIDLTGN